MNMKCLLIGLLVFFTFIDKAHSQDNKQDNYKTIEFNSTLGFDSVYDKAIEYLQSKDYFILSLDRSSGFIQAKTYTPDNKMFSETMGNRRIFNFMVKTSQDDITKISLVIFLEKSLRRSVEGGWSYFDLDVGIIEDSKIYTKVLDGLKNYIIGEKSEVVTSE